MIDDRLHKFFLGALVRIQVVGDNYLFEFGHSKGLDLGNCETSLFLGHLPFLGEILALYWGFAVGPWTFLRGLLCFFVATEVYLLMDDLYRLELFASPSSSWAWICLQR